MTVADADIGNIRDAGLRVTAPRLAVLRALSTRPHADADTVFEAVRTELPNTSLQAVYGVLSSFTDAGLVRRIEPAGSRARFERRVGDNHHHLVCRTCGRIEDVDCVVGEAPCLAPSDARGFAIDEAEVVFWGRCGDCQDASPARAHARDADAVETTDAASELHLVSAPMPAESSESKESHD